MRACFASIPPPFSQPSLFPSLQLDRLSGGIPRRPCIFFSFCVSAAMLLTSSLVTPVTLHTEARTFLGIGTGCGSDQSTAFFFVSPLPPHHPPVLPTRVRVSLLPALTHLATAPMGQDSRQPPIIAAFQRYFRFGFRHQRLSSLSALEPPQCPAANCPNFVDLRARFLHTGCLAAPRLSSKAQPPEHSENKSQAETGISTWSISTRRVFADAPRENAHWSGFFLDSRSIHGHNFECFCLVCETLSITARCFPLPPLPIKKR